MDPTPALPLPSYALVTAGGTAVHLDRMRVLGNLAEGDFGVVIAGAFARRGVPVVLLMSRLGCYKHRGALGEGIALCPYFTYDEYGAGIDAIVASHGRPRWACATAAVSDYGPEDRAPGKIPSDQETLVIRLRKLPKVIDTWRDRFGARASLVGFKLLSRADVGVDGLVAAAQRQNDRARLDATVGNFAEDLGGEGHPIWWVPRGGAPTRVEGTRADVAEEIVRRTLESPEGTYPASGVTNRY